MSTPSDLTLSGPALIYALINAANTLAAGAASATNITLGTPIVIDPAGNAASHNTQLTLTAVPGQGYKDSVDITYNRLDIQADVMAVKAPGGAQVEDTGSFTKNSDLLASLNAAYGLNLQASDLADPTAVVSIGAYPTVVNLAMAAGSYAYLGTLALSVTQPAISLTTAVSNTAMDGLSM